MRVLVTILDSITETSMPFNEFVLYRANHYSNEQQILIICGSQVALPKVDIPENLRIIYAGRSLRGIRRTIRKVLSELKNVSYSIHLHQVQSGFLAEMAMLGTGFRKKVLFTVHSTFSGYKAHNKFLSFINAILAQRTTCVSNVSYLDYPKVIKWIKGNRIQALQNGVDMERIDTVISGVKPRAFTGYNFIYVARLIPLKNHSFLVDVLKKCDDRVHFTFVGAEDAEKSIRKKAEETGVIDRICFTGLIPRNEVFKLLLASDYYISSSTLEGLPVSVLEAMYCGLPCILSDIPQHREIASDETIILPYNADVWVEEINRLVDLEPQQYKERSDHIRNYVQKNFSLRTMHEKYDKVYDLL